MSIGEGYYLIFVLKTVIDIFILCFYHRVKKKWKTTLDSEWIMIPFMGYIVLIFSLVVVFLVPDDPRILWFPASSIFIDLLLAFLIFHDVFIYDESGFYRGWNLFRKKKNRYEDILSCKIGRNVYVINIGNKFRELNKGIENERFILYAKERYQDILGKEIPETAVAGERDPFGGRIERLGNYREGIGLAIAIPFLISVFFLGRALHNINDKNAEFTLAKITEYYYYEDNEDFLGFYAEGYETEFVISLENVRDDLMDKIDFSMNHDHLMKIYFRNGGGKYDFFYKVYSLRTPKGEEYVTFDEINAKDRKEDFVFMSIFLGLGIASTVAVKIQENTIKNPEKYSERIQKKIKKTEEKYKI